MLTTTRSGTCCGAPAAFWVLAHVLKVMSPKYVPIILQDKGPLCCVFCATASDFTISQGCDSSGQMKRTFQLDHYPSHFMDEDSDAQRGWVTCSCSNSWWMGRRAKSQAGFQVPWAYPACNHRVKRDAGAREANLETVLVAGHFEGLVGGVNKCVYKHGLWRLTCFYFITVTLCSGGLWVA